jgi:dynein heavy chain 1
MNSLLASGEVPGLFEGPDMANLQEEAKMAASRDNVSLSTEEEHYKFFCRHVQNNLHVVFTMNPSNEDFDNRNATAPALYNRCVVDWFGEWSSMALYQVGHEFTQDMRLSDGPPGTAYVEPEGFEEEDMKKPMMMGSLSERDCVVSTLVFIHESVYKACVMLARNTGKRSYVTPRHYLDFIKQYKSLSEEKYNELTESKHHLTVGLKKLKDTQKQVARLREQLKEKDKELKQKEKEAKKAKALE